MVNISINLEPNGEGENVYYSGQRLAGKVHLTLSEPKQFRAFYLLVSGVARCHWTESRSRTVGHGENRRTENYTEHYEGRQDFINSKTFLFGQENAQTIDIAPGTYNYNFTAELPEFLPETIVGDYGSIEYKVEAVLDIPWRFDREIWVPFVVRRIDDLNIYPDLKIPQSQEEIKTFCCFCCGSEPCMITITIPYGGFAAGQDLPIKIDYVNKSDTEITQTILKIKRTITFKSNVPTTETKHQYDKIAEYSIEGVKGRESRNIDFGLPIPPSTINSNEIHCHVIKISYNLKVECSVDGCHLNPEFIFPIVIGSVGIGSANNFNQNQNASWTTPNNDITDNPPPFPTMPSTVYNFPAPSFLPSAPPADNLDDLPPSFEEAMKTIGQPVPSVPNQDDTSRPKTTIGWSFND